MFHKSGVKLLLMVLGLSILLLTACQQAPENNVVISKNDGSFDAAISESVSGESNAFTAEGPSIAYKNNVENATGTVKIQIDIDESELYTGSLPVVQITPHSITPDDAKKIAEALFGSLPLYETSFDPVVSAEKAEEKLLLWRQIANDAELSDLYGSNYSTAKTIISETLDNMATDNSFAQSTTTPELCRWEYHPDFYYLPDSLTQGASNGNNTILACVKNDDVSYRFWVTNRDEQDYRVQSISAYVCSEYISPWDLETLHMVRGLCGYEKPSAEDISQVKIKAMETIKNMDIGSWDIVECNAGTYKYWQNDESPAYVVNVVAVPSYNGTPLLHLPQLENLKSDDIYASNYYYSELKFTYAASGQLVEMNYTSPVDVVTEVNHNVEVIDFAGAMKLVEQQLQLREVSSFDEAIGSMDGSQINLEVSEIEFGLARVKMKDNARDFYLVPAIHVKGDYQLMLNGDRMYTYSKVFGEDASFLVINLIDGSIINTNLGY